MSASLIKQEKPKLVNLVFNRLLLFLKFVFVPWYWSRTDWNDIKRGIVSLIVTIILFFFSFLSFLFNSRHVTSGNWAKFNEDKRFVSIEKQQTNKTRQWEARQSVFSLLNLLCDGKKVLEFFNDVNHIDQIENTYFIVYWLSHLKIIDCDEKCSIYLWAESCSYFHWNQSTTKKRYWIYHSISLFIGTTS